MGRTSGSAVTSEARGLNGMSSPTLGAGKDHERHGCQAYTVDRESLKSAFDFYQILERVKRRLDPRIIKKSAELLVP